MCYVLGVQRNNVSRNAFHGTRHRLVTRLEKGMHHPQRYSNQSISQRRESSREQGNCAGENRQPASQG